MTQPDDKSPVFCPISLQTTVSFKPTEKDIFVFSDESIDSAIAHQKALYMYLSWYSRKLIREQTTLDQWGNRITEQKKKRESAKRKLFFRGFIGVLAQCRSILSCQCHWASTGREMVGPRSSQLVLQMDYRELLQGPKVVHISDPSACEGAARSHL